jgi:HNH endonuclease/AP2 domain
MKRDWVMPAPDWDRLHQVLYLDADEGVLRWRMTLSNRAVAGTVAGHTDIRWPHYVRIGFDGRVYLAHVLVWYMVYREWIPREIDHFDRNPENNHPDNLRRCTQQQNVQNKSMQRNNTSGYRGVTWDKSTRAWVAQVQLTTGGKAKNYRVGRFSTREEAADAARLKRIELFGDFAPFEDWLDEPGGAAGDNGG